jgi:hypothetical protein
LQHSTDGKPACHPQRHCEGLLKMPANQTHSSDRHFQSGSKSAITTVLLANAFTVTYVFNAGGESSLSIPYAVAVNGVARTEFAQKTLRVSVNREPVTVTGLAQGQQVSLFLNSDASPAWRKQAVYAVTVGNRDVVVTITEKKGKHTDTDSPILIKDANPTVEAAKKADAYRASLTGDIWMKVSHKYTPAEVQPRLPAGTSAVVEAAVMSIYQGLSSSELPISEPGSSGKPSRTLAVVFIDSVNPKENINRYELLADGLPRVHPAGYAALFTAALENNITALTLSSCWRPILGSIVHRIGLGLDVYVLGGTVLNRQELRNAFSGNAPSRHGNHNDHDNVTDAEVTAFGEYEDAIRVSKAADKAEEEAENALKKANKQTTQFPITDVKAKLATAKTVAKAANTDMNTKGNTWNNARDKGEPSHARLFRVSLLKCSCVGQLFDPWYMNSNTHTEKPIPNKQISPLEMIHAHHLHITVNDPKIL